ncbi:uncharacterized protein LOC111600719 isoform X6 [Drosophila hydei]|uniref:Uncharacterized protein LOC111600719 isoform X6 n=1 Tax=Drosophila hydei TaxID=7224 RepID=A0A6J1M7A0_DROHY|nr:uncharacterized protein LOC111600719 isoform X6 [Drosophila hydei]
MDILWSLFLISFFFIVIYLAWIVDNILHKINEERIRIAAQRSAVMPAASALDRQNNVELGRQHSRYGDIFYIEPNSQEAARIREQLEKDEKDLPSYDEVMRMCNLTSPTAAAAAPTQSSIMETSVIGIAALPAPPYSEIDPHQNVVPASPTTATVTAANTSEPSPSTSRAAQIPT